LSGKHSDYSTKSRAAQHVYGGAGQSPRREFVVESQGEATTSHRVKDGSGLALPAVDLLDFWFCRQEVDRVNWSGETESGSAEEQPGKG